MKSAVWFIVTCKELKDASRDRRAIMALLVFPILGPALVYFMLTALLDIGEEVADIDLPVMGADNAPDLIDFLRQNGVNVTAAEIEGVTPPIQFDANTTEAVGEAISSRQHDFVLIIPDDFPDNLAQSQTVNVELHHDSSRTRTGPQVNRVQQLIQGWGRETRTLRLLARGVDPQIINPVAVQTIDVSTPQARAQVILGMIPLFVIIAAFVSGMGVAVDETAGERERKSLEPLLVNPIRRGSIVLGKWMAAAVFSTAGLLLVLFLNLFALSRVPLEQMGLTFAIGPVEIAGILLTTLPLAFFATSIQIFVGIFARSFKDAQAYLSLIMMLPMIPYLYNIFNTQGREFWMNFVPMLGQNMLLADVVAGRSPPVTDFLLAGLTVLLCSFIFMTLAARVFMRERIIFT